MVGDCLLLERAPDPVAVARIFVKRFWPSGLTGSLPVILEGRRKLLTKLEYNPNPELADFAIVGVAALTVYRGAAEVGNRARS